MNHPSYIPRTSAISSSGDQDGEFPGTLLGKPVKPVEIIPRAVREFDARLVCICGLSPKFRTVVPYALLLTASWIAFT